MLAGRVTVAGVQSIAPEATPASLSDGSLLPFLGQLGRFAINVPPQSGADLVPEGSATLMDMSVDVSRTKGEAR
jgi:hypothetical protein